MVHGTLEVLLVSAKGLDNNDFLANMDPYVILTVRTQDKKSTVVSGQGEEPEWNETFSFTVSDDADELRLKIMDKDSFSADDYVGEATVPLEPVFTEGSLPPTPYNVVNLEKEYRGEIKVGLTFTPEGGDSKESYGGGGGRKGSSYEGEDSYGGGRRKGSSYEDEDTHGGRKESSYGGEDSYGGSDYGGGRRKGSSYEDEDSHGGRKVSSYEGVNSYGGSGYGGGGRKGSSYEGEDSHGGRKESSYKGEDSYGGGGYGSGRRKGSSYEDEDSHGGRG